MASGVLGSVIPQGVVDATKKLAQTSVTSLSPQDVVEEVIKDAYEALWEVNHQIWSNPETAYTEHKAHDTLCDFLEARGFQVTRHAYGLETAFEATSGSGGRLINFNAEYDSLPGIGHACGHNLIATASLTAFVALSEVLKKLDIPGRTVLLGTPAEEGGGGKVKLIQAGAFKNVDVSLMAHGAPPRLSPSDTRGRNLVSVAGARMLAREQLFVEFHGKAAHAGGAPWDGHNALDAFVAAYNNLSMLRQQIFDTDRIHAAILEAPKVANVIPPYTKAVFVARSETLRGLKNLSARITKCINAAALATDCEVKIEAEDYYADIILNEHLCDRYVEKMKSFGYGALSTIPQVLTGSTDQGNVSYEVPTLHSMFTIPADPEVSIHHPSFTEVAGKREAHEVAVMVGKTLALLGADCATDDKFYEATKQEWQQKRAQDGHAHELPVSKVAAGCC